MNKNILTFVLGFISGSAATVIFAKKYYEKVANDEIEQVKETYARKAEIEEAGKIDEDLKAVDKVIKEHQYNTVICIALNIVGHYLTMSTVLKMERKA